MAAESLQLAAYSEADASGVESATATTLTPGVCLVGKCANCEPPQVVNPLGYKEFSLFDGDDHFECECPFCQEAIEPSQLSLIQRLRVQNLKL